MPGFASNFPIMRSLFTILSCVFVLPLWANMAQPLVEGTQVASPFISQHVDILKETILIQPDENFDNARFTIEYHIQADSQGVQIPLLFYAYEYGDDFRVWVDGESVGLGQVPEEFSEVEGTPFADFGQYFESRPVGEVPFAEIWESALRSFYVSIHDLKYFETDLSAGIHVIRVEYNATRWDDLSDWIIEKSFRYAMSPARYWRSFGELEITLDGSEFDRPMTTNFGPPDQQQGGMSTWTFTSIPADVLLISYEPEISPTARTLIAISPEGLAGILAVLLVLLHFAAMRFFRKVHPHRRYSWVMMLGIPVVPFLTLLGYVYAFDLIDAAIGPEASNYHGYTILIFFLYPILLVIYGLGMWLVDRGLKRRYGKS